MSAGAPGLSAAEAARRLAEDGPNTLPGDRRRGIWAITGEVLREPMLLLLLAGAFIYLLLGDLREALVLAASIVVVALITIVQERRSERALAALRDLSSPRALVIRDGAAVRVAGAEVVRGDLMLLAEGDRVPADARLLAANNLVLDESLLTGESLPVDKDTGMPLFSGTLVLKGQGRAEVTAIGEGTAFGRIGRSLADLEIEKTGLQRETARLVRIIAVLAVATSTAFAALSVVLQGDWLNGILSGITLAMATVPEEFPLVLTVFLALGAWRIARHGVLTRRMPAIETLGAATVLCVDKTGTLTENRMALADTIAVTGDAERLLETAALACELDPFDPMERAIVTAAGRRVETIRSTWTLERDYPLTPGFLAVCHAWRSPAGERRVAIKGAPETVQPLCGLEASALDGARKRIEEAGARGLRLLAVAETGWDAAAWPDDPRTYRFRWLGFAALADPVRAEVPDAVARCLRAGVRVVMVTGDYPGTAVAVAAQAGIPTAGGVLTGPEVEALSGVDLTEAVRRVNVFARILPEQKLRLISAFKAAGEIVAMTGDGVNDAPALKAAHIGVAMGRRGTDVAREASALVLLEDDFSSIVESVRFGRRIYENLRNAMRFILAVHVPTVGMSFLPLLFGWPPLLFPVHIVFLEFLIDPACALVFEAERSEEVVMQRPPRPPGTRLFSRRMLGVSLLLGTSVLAAICLAYVWALRTGLADGQARSLGFAAIVFGALAMIHVTRSRHRTLGGGLHRPNAALWWITAGTLAGLAVACYVRPASEVFKFAPPDAVQVGVAAAAGVGGVLWYEIYKLARPRHAASS